MRTDRSTSSSPDDGRTKRLGAEDREILASFPSAHLAERLGISPITTREWRRAGRIPPMWMRAVHVLVAGDLGSIHRAWKGWILHCDGTLIAPESGDYIFTPGEVRSIRFSSGSIRRLEQQVQALRAQVRTLQDQLEGHYAFPQQADWVAGRYQQVKEPPPTADVQLRQAREELERRDALRREQIDPPRQRRFYGWSR